MTEADTGSDLRGMKDSGYGKEAGIDSIKDYTRVKTTWFYTSDEPALDPFSMR